MISFLGIHKWEPDSYWILTGPSFAVQACVLTVNILQTEAVSNSCKTRSTIQLLGDGGDSSFRVVVKVK
jgi:hypothetical protein